MSAPIIDMYTWATPNGWKASCTLRKIPPTSGSKQKHASRNAWKETEK